MTHRLCKRATGKHLRVSHRTDDRRKGWLQAGNLRFPCALGRSGTTHAKREGDGGTPVGLMRFGCLYWRADRLRKPRSNLHSNRLLEQAGWCDDPRHRRYNRPVTLPFPASHEQLWREDGLYDLIIELSWNMRPAIKGRGSAIFMHVARPGYLPTEGCVALRRDHLLRLLPLIGPKSRLQILG